MTTARDPCSCLSEKGRRWGLPSLQPQLLDLREGAEVGAASFPELGGAGHVGKHQVSLGLVSRGGGLWGRLQGWSEEG